MKRFALLLIAAPTLALANAPGMMTLTFELGFMAVLIIGLVKAEFSLEKKGIVFIAYVALGVLTKTIWIPIIIASALYFYFIKTNTDDT